jgi:hypothetical protein
MPAIVRYEMFPSNPTTFATSPSPHWRPVPQTQQSAGHANHQIKKEAASEVQ